LFANILNTEPDAGRRAYVEDKRVRYLERAKELRTLTATNEVRNLKPVEETNPPQLEPPQPTLQPSRPFQTPDLSVTRDPQNSNNLDDLTRDIEALLGKIKVTKDPAQKKSLGKQVSLLLDQAEKLKEENGSPVSPIEPRTMLGPSSKSPRGRGSPSPAPATRDRVSPSNKSRLPQPRPSVSPTPPSNGRLLDLSSTLTTTLTREEKDVLRASSRINGLLVLPWSQEDPACLPPSNTQPSFIDPDGLPSLSAKQSSQRVVWKRPHEWLRNPCLLPLSPEDLVTSIRQETVMDCTVVASLVSLAASCALHDRSLPNVIFPASYSTHGRYLAKLHLNGIPRALTIDDLLPFSAAGQPLFTHAPGSLWVSLVEKAWIKANGGYEYPGGGASVDLYGLVGWIPEEVYFASCGDTVGQLWDRVFDGWKTGRAIPSVATAACDSGTGLVSNHAYAVLELLLTPDGERILRLKNPWGRKRWTGRFSHLDKDSWTPALRRALSYDPFAASQEDDGTFYISYTDLTTHFDSLHINWDPSHFPHKRRVHVHWDASSGPIRDAYSLGGNPQFAINTSGDGGEVWLLLSKHVVEREENLDYMTLFLYAETGGERVYYPGKAEVEGEYINRWVESGYVVLKSTDAHVGSPHVLVRFTAPAAPSSNTLVVSQHEKRRSLSFTVHAFSTSSFTFAEIPKGYPHEHRTTGSWTETTAGGCMSFSSFYTNPQYKVTVQSSAIGKKAQLFAMLEAPRTFPVNVKLVKGGSRISSAAQDAVILGSGDYRHGFAFARGEVEAGDYVAVVSTWEPELVGDFFFTIGSTAGITVSLLPPEGTGMKMTRLLGEWVHGKTAAGCVHFRLYERNPVLLFELRRPSKVMIRLIPVGMDPPPAANSAVFRAAITGDSTNGVRAQGNEVLGSGAYSDWVQGVVTPAKKLPEGRFAAVLSTWEPKAGKFAVVFYCEDEEVVAELKDG